MPRVSSGYLGSHSPWILGSLGFLAKHGISPRGLSILWMQKHGKNDNGNHSSGTHGIFNAKNPPSTLSKVSRIWLLLWDITLWTIWVERNDCTFNNNKQEEKGMQQSFWQSILKYAKIDCNIAHKDAEKANHTRQFPILSKSESYVWDGMCPQYSCFIILISKYKIEDDKPHTKKASKSPL